MTPEVLKHILVNQVGAKEVASQPFEVRLNCFKCDDHKGHLYFNVKKQVGFCQRRGCIVTEFELLRHYNIQSSEEDLWESDFFASIQQSDQPEEQEDPYVLWDDSISIFDPLAKPGLLYLKRRGLKKRDIKAFRFRYNLSKLPGCIVTPIFESNELVYWVARHIWKRFHSNVHKPKLNILFNFDQVESPSAVIVEGIFDAVFMRKFAVSTLGKHISDGQAQKICNNFREVTICYDADAHEATLQAAKKFQSMGVKYVYVTLLDYGDPGDLKYEGYEFIMDHRKKFSTDFMIMEKYNGL